MTTRKTAENFEELAINQQRALVVLASGGSCEAAAKEAGVSLQTLSAWQRREDFQRLLKASVSKVYNAALAQVTLIACKSVKELEEIIDDPEVPARVKISAIALVLSTAKDANQGALEDRLKKIEELLDEHRAKIS